MRYRHLVQKKMFCCPACIQMILFRRDKWVDQTKIAKGIGVKIKKKYKDLYDSELETVPNDSLAFGFKLEKFNDGQVKAYLAHFGLEFHVILASEIDNVEDVINNALDKNQDVILNFHMKPLTGEEFAHYVLVDSIKQDIITVCDPHYVTKNYWEISIAQLKEAMSANWDEKERGLVIF